MLSELYIENVAVIERTCIDFCEGFNVFTGETGAGKSIIINSVNAIIGKRTNKDIIRNGSNNATITAQFTCFDKTLKEKLKSIDIPLDEDDNLTLERVLNISGRTNCKINSKPATASQIRNLSDYIINIHGQNDNYDLLSKSVQLQYIDELCEHKELLQKYKKLFKDTISLRNKIKKLVKSEEDNLKRIDLLNYQIAEIQEANLKEDELETLLEKKKICQNSEKIATILTEIENICNTQNGVVDSLDTVSVKFSSLSQLVKPAEKVSERFYSAYYEIKDCLDEITEVCDVSDFNAFELEEIENRLDLIYRLSSKYGDTINDILAYAKNCEKELEKISLSDKEKEGLKEKYQKSVLDLKQYANTISENRKKTAVLFSKRVQNELEFLNMPNTRFEINIDKTDLTQSGIDDISFMISTNLGEPLKPIDKIASGGELSRIMLAIKSVLSDKEHIPTLIFDEIDTGISGKAAKKVGLKLKSLSKFCQVICITHLAQIACYADKHFLIEKNDDNNRTFTTVNALDYEGRKNELARIISGDTASEATLKSAEEMLKFPAE